MNLIHLSIEILWLALGVIILCAIIWLALYAVKQILPVPATVEKVIWLCVLILVLIGLLTLVSGGSIGRISFHRLSIAPPVPILTLA